MMLMKHLLSSSMALALGLSSTYSHAQLGESTKLSELGVLEQKNMSLKLANKLSNATMDACHAQSRSAVVVVLDRGGNVLTLQRDETVGPHNTDAARKKAFTALSTKTRSREFAENIRNNPDATYLHSHDELLLIGGGVPVKLGNEVIGAIGVGGAGGAAIDEGCALAAIQQVLGSLSQ